MSVRSLSSIAYNKLVNSIGLYSHEIKIGHTYYFIEEDGTFTYLEECVFHECDSRICWHEGPSCWENIKFKNTNEKRYEINRGNSGLSGERLPITEQIRVY
jgi:hypothetical protein